MRATGQNVRNSGINCALGPSKSIRYTGYFVIAGFVIAGLVSTYFTVILPGFQMLSVITGSSLQRGSTVLSNLNIRGLSRPKSSRNLLSDQLETYMKAVSRSK